jgi:ABC-type branched-subunit amino acid transport system ATPase component
LSPHLEVENITASFGPIRAVDQISFTISHRGIYGLVGPNGAGKTTILNLISGLLVPSSGRIRLNGMNLAGLTPWQIAQKGVGRTFQDPRLLARMTVLENVLIGFNGQMGERPLKALIDRRLVQRQEAILVHRAKDLLAVVGLDANSQAVAGNLSWGSQKLLSLVRMLASEAQLLLLDEPTSGVGTQELDRLIDALAFAVDSGRSVVVVEHNIAVIKQIARWVYFLQDGRIRAEGPPEELLTSSSVKSLYLGG